MGGFEKTQEIKKEMHEEEDAFYAKLSKRRDELMGIINKPLEEYEDMSKEFRKRHGPMEEDEWKEWVDELKKLDAKGKTKEFEATIKELERTLPEPDLGVDLTYLEKELEAADILPTHLKVLNDDILKIKTKGMITKVQGGKITYVSKVGELTKQVPFQEMSVADIKKMIKGIKLKGYKLSLGGGGKVPSKEDFQDKKLEFEQWLKEHPNMPEKEQIEKARVMFNIPEETKMGLRVLKQGNSMKIYSDYADFGTQEIKDLTKAMDADQEGHKGLAKYLASIRSKGKKTKISCDGMTPEECKEKIKKLVLDRKNVEATNIVQIGKSGEGKTVTYTDKEVRKKDMTKEEIEEFMKKRVGAPSTQVMTGEVTMIKDGKITKKKLEEMTDTEIKDFQQKWMKGKVGGSSQQMTDKKIETKEFKGEITTFNEKGEEITEVYTDENEYKEAQEKLGKNRASLFKEMANGGSAALDTKEEFDEEVKRLNKLDAQGRTKELEEEQKELIEMMKTKIPPGEKITFSDGKTTEKFEGEITTFEDGKEKKEQFTDKDKYQA